MDNEEIKKLQFSIQQLMRFAYDICNDEVKSIIENNVTDTDRIEKAFDKILHFVEDEEFYKLYYKLVNYVEGFDSSLGAMFRRVIRVLLEGY